MKEMLSGRKLALAIQDSGLTQAEVARRCGCSKQSIGGWISRGTTEVAEVTLHKLRSALGCEDLTVMVKV